MWRGVYLRIHACVRPHASMCVCVSIRKLKWLTQHSPRAAAVQWANMNPELSPPSFTKKAGKLLYAAWGQGILYPDILLTDVGP